MKHLTTLIYRTTTWSVICLLFITSIIGCQKKNTVKINGEGLLPEVQKVEVRKDISINPHKFKTVYLYSEDNKDIRFAADLLKTEVKELFNYNLNIEVVQSYSDLSHPAIILGIPTEDAEFTNFSSELPSPEKDNLESYVLDIKEDLITISGGGDAGLFYGVQTLIQLMEDAKWKNAEIAGMTIEDWPDLELRWVHYNYFFHLDRYEYIKETIKKLSKYKVNGVVFEFEDRFKYQSQPFVAAPTSLTSEQVKELTLFARNYHIDIVPLVQGFGHAAYILKHDEVKHLREDPEIYQSFCPLKEETYEVIFDLFRETIEATPGVKYFHVGADEVRVMGKCPLCSKKIDEVGDLGLHLIWLNRVQDFMKEHGRTIVFWDDMPLKQAGIYRSTHTAEFDSIQWAEGTEKLTSIVDKFPQEGIFMRWNYDLGREKGNIKILEWYKEHNFKTMAATAVIGNWPLIPDYNEMPEIIKSFVTLAAEEDALGELCTAWGDDAGNHFEIYWLGFLASAEYAWSSKSPDTLDQFWEKYIQRFFGPNTESLISAFHNLSERVFFWNKALLKKGTKHRASVDFINLPNLENKPSEGTWTEQFKPLMDEAHEEKLKNAEAIEILERNMDKVTDNAYNLEVFLSMGRLMEAHCDYILSIGEIANYCDKVANTKEEDRELVEEYNEMITAVESAWSEYLKTYENLKEIWEVSRYPKGEEGYVMNPQTNYLAGKTSDLSYLVLAEKRLDLLGYVKSLK